MERPERNQTALLLKEGLTLKHILVSFLSLFVLTTTTANAEVADFEDLSLSTDSYWNGSDGSGGFTSGGAGFNNLYDDTYGPYWEGFAYSNMRDTQTQGFDNQYSAITGVGVNSSSNYGVSYSGFYGVIPTVTFPEPIAVSGVYLTNTTYAFWTIMEGGAFSKKFGGDGGDDPDWFKLTITGRDEEDNPTGTVDFYLTDYRFDDNTKDFIVDQWTWVDLSSLGDVMRLEFALSSSDTGDFGMNTPAYFAMDHLNGLPFAAGTDLDGDGIPDDQEVDVRVDLNGDGIPDLFQSEIKCVNTVVGNGQMGLSIENSPHVTEIVDIESVTPPSPIPEDVTIPLGLLSFTLQVQDPGDQVTVRVYLSEPAPTGAKWYKYDVIDGWREYPHAHFSPDGTYVDFELKDGDFDLGDADRIEDGMIVDPSGMGLLPEATAPPESAAPSEGADSSGRSSLGCFVAAAASGWAPKTLKLPVASYRESSTVRNADFFWIRSLTPPQAAGSALAFAVQGFEGSGVRVKCLRIINN
jgi:hypothetical protein